MQILPRALAAGWRVELRGRNREVLARIDGMLWQNEGFLPHGMAGGPHDDRQPVLLRPVDAPPATNRAACLMALDGAGIEPAEAGGLERICVIFGGNDPSAVETARGQWRVLTGAGVAAEYWSEAAGKWERKR